MRRTLLLVNALQRSIKKFVKTFRQKCARYLMHASLISCGLSVYSFLQNEVVPMCSTIGCTFGFVQTLCSS